MIGATRESWCELRDADINENYPSAKIFACDLTLFPEERTNLTDISARILPPAGVTDGLCRRQI